MICHNCAPAQRHTTEQRNQLSSLRPIELHRYPDGNAASRSARLRSAFAALQNFAPPHARFGKARAGDCSRSRPT